MERPILFSGGMVKAILDGRKSQTRRVIKPQPKVVHAMYSDGSLETNCIFRSGDQRIHCPYGVPGDKLWVREKWAKPEPGVMSREHDGSPVYAADYPPMTSLGIGRKWQPSIFMPRWASRITLEIVSLRVERVQEISEKDAGAEGIDLSEVLRRGIPVGERRPYANVYRELWDSINGKKHPWSSNPFVWVIEFKKEK